MLDSHRRRRKDLESVKRSERKRSGHPLRDPLHRYKQPLSTNTRGRAIIEFDSVDVVEIRREFGLNRRQFAHLIGVSVHTLRNWETGRRRPHGPARALLRAIDADPMTLARALMVERHRPLPAELDDQAASF
jgi:DNA-binding transcriptional regulator YiaG